MPRKRGTPAVTDTTFEQEETFDHEQGEQHEGEQHEGEQTGLTDEQKAAKAAAEAEELAAELADIESATEAPAELLDETTPTRKRGDLQRAIDAIALRTYEAWIEKGRPSVWAKLPVITYYLDPEKVAERRKLIRKSPQVVRAQPYRRDDGEYIEPTGVRIRWGADDLVLTHEKAEKIGRPDDAGKTVLSWCVVDKRKSSRTNGETAATDDDDDDDDD